jgi:hypothetical protein
LPQQRALHGLDLRGAVVPVHELRPPQAAAEQCDRQTHASSSLFAALEPVQWSLYSIAIGIIAEEGESADSPRPPSVGTEDGALLLTNRCAMTVPIESDGGDVSCAGSCRRSMPMPMPIYPCPYPYRSIDDRCVNARYVVGRADPGTGCPGTSRAILKKVTIFWSRSRHPLGPKQARTGASTSYQLPLGPACRFSYRAWDFG